MNSLKNIYKQKSSLLKEIVISPSSKLKLKTILRNTLSQETSALMFLRRSRPKKPEINIWHKIETMILILILVALKYRNSFIKNIALLNHMAKRLKTNRIPYLYRLN